MKSLIKINITLIILLFPLQSFAELQSGRLEGKVIDQTTKQAIIGAKIEVMGTKFLAVTNPSGEFEIDGLEPRTYHLKISAPYYVTTYKTDIAVTSAQSTKLTIEMKLASYEVDEVVVTSERFFEHSPDMNVSINSLSSEEIRRAPGAIEDVSRMMQTLPGVTTATDARNDLIVRGGSPIENFIMIDGIEVPNINHFGTQGASGGPIGMLNVDFLSDVNFSAGGFPAKYGDRLSSIMDIKYRDGDKNNFTGKFDLGIAGAGFILEGPIQKGESSFIVSARKSYLDLILSSTNLTAVPNYTNFNLKTTVAVSDKHKFEILGLGGIDKIEFKGFENDDDPFIRSTNYSGWQTVVGITDKWLAGNSTYIQSSLSVNYYQKDIEIDSLGKLTYFNNSLDAEYTFRSDVSHRLSPSDLIEVGVVAKYLRNDNKLFRAATIDFYGTYREELNYNSIAEAYKLGTYLQYSANFFKGFNFTLSGRYDHFSFINSKSVFSPRVSAGYYLFEDLRINAAYGFYYQAPPLLWLVTFEQNKNLTHIRTNQFVLGLEYYPAQDIKATIEFFNKDYSGYPTSEIIPQVTYANAGADYYTLGLEPLLPNSTGYARGVEFFIHKKLTDNIYGMFNYSFSTIRFKSLDGIERPSSFDYRNVLTVILGYKFTDNFEVSTKYRFMGGRPYTPFDEELSSQLNQTVYDYTRYNAVRFDNYNRLDIRMDYRFEFIGWSLVTYLDLQNVFNVKNVEQIIWNQKENAPDVVYQWSFLPAGGIKIEF